MKVKNSQSAEAVQPAAGSERAAGKIRWTVAMMRGQALIIVLLFLVLCTFIAIAFLTNVTSSGVGENASASENRASQLATTAVQLVEGTITNATVSGTFPTVAWACQPGMIRTYGTSGGPNNSYLPSFAPLAYYKLYSSGTMVVTTAMTNLNMNPSAIFSADVPATWDKMPSYYTDLNAPLFVTNPATSGTTTVFPIADPRAADPDIAVTGFGYVNSMPGSTSGTIDGIVTSGTTYANDTTSRLPMPVAWIYVLKDGTLTVPLPPPSGVSGGASWTNATNPPTPANPIVGRIAFWTDDESAKVNINTASEGTYWDTPVGNSGTSTDVMTSGTVPIGDDTLAMIEPAQHEYQRYAGHPATTCLSAVFGNIINAAIGSDRAQMVKYITDAIPRVSDYGSGVQGTQAPSNSSTTTLGGTVASGTTSTTPSVIVDEDRLYANLDEFQFAPPDPSNIQANRPLQALTGLSSGTTAQEEQNDVDTCRFFLTAHSKAPELNMFGLPRVSIWPIWDMTNAPSGTTLTQFDSEILRCSTVNATGTNNDPHYFCFFRYDPTSPTNDFPTTTGTLPTVNRNPMVFSYLRNLMGTKVPGFGFPFSSKYAAKDTNQIVTEIFDYIRSINLADNSQGAVPYTSGTNAGQVVPIQISGTGQGFGRTSTISELALALVKVDDRLNTSLAEETSGTTNLATTINVTGGPSNISTVNPASQTLIEWTLIPNIFSPSLGYVPLMNNLRIRFTGINLNIGNYSTGLISYPSVPDTYNVGTYSTTRDTSIIGGPGDPFCLVLNGNSPRNSMYPTGLAMVTGTSLISGSGTLFARGTIAISGTVYASLYAPAGSTGTANQQFTFRFPTTSVPIPNINPGTTGTTGSTWYGTFRVPASAYIGGTTATFTYPPAVSGTIAAKSGTRINGFSGGDFLGSEGTDVVRSLTATGTLNNAALYGDTRLVAVSSTIPANTYQLTGTAASTVFINNTHCLRNASSVQVMTTGFASATMLATTPASSYMKPPDVPPPPAFQSGTAAIPTQGDWDNGIGLAADGPWINKPDEGMTNGTPGSVATTPYIGSYQVVGASGAPMKTQFSPNRQISSPVMFGSLPVGTDHPWETLLFRPATLPGYHGTYTHPGNPSPGSVLPDHLLLDLFWMPVVEPYGISEPLATSGKINLNTQIAPFTYITRTTGLNAVLKSVMITGLDSNYATSCKGSMTWQGSSSTANGATWNPRVVSRYPIDPNQTIAQLTGTNTDSNPYPEFARTSHSLATPNFFVSATQICDLPLVPLVSGTTFGPNATPLSTFWTAKSLTGCNSLDRPYSMIYPRVTTKSNIFTVHVIAQSLKQGPSDLSNGAWTENVSQVTGEVRGAYTIEKYYDPNADDLSYWYSATKMQAYTASSDGAIPTTGSTVGLRAAKWRLLSVKRFGQ